MITISTKQIAEDWMRIYAQPESEVLDQLNVRDKGTVTSLLGDKNEIWLGRPEVFDVRPLLPAKVPQGEFLRQILQTHDMVLIQFACSFRPHPQCEFVRATVQVHIENEVEQVEQPIAYDVFPAEVMMPVTYRRSFSISPSLKLGFVQVAQVEVSAFKKESSREYIIYQPEIVGFGKGESCPGWDFNRTSSRKIIGMKDLFISIKKVKHSPIRLRLSVSNVFVQTNIGRIPLSTLFLSGGEEVLFEEQYIIVQ